MAGAKINIGVTGVAQFKQGMNQAKQAAKTLDAQLALTEKEFRATGDAEGYMEKKTAELKAKLEAQKAVVDNAQKALDQMAKNGVDKSSTAYQKLYQEMLKAKGEMLETEHQIGSVSEAEETATDSTKDMTKAMQDVNKSVSFDNITKGLKSITDGIEGVITKAWKMGEALVKNTLGAGSWADELATTATQWEDTLEAMSGGKSATEFLQRMRYTATIIGKSGQATFTEKLTLFKNEDVGGFAMVGESPATVAEVVQYNWKAEPWKSISANFGGALSFGKDIDEACPGTVTLTFKKNTGAVAIQGQFGSYKATASANLTPITLPGAKNKFVSYLQVYFPPATSKGFAGYGIRLPLTWNGNAFVVGLGE